MKKLIISLMVEELERANHMNGTSFSSPHEGYAVILEEMDELFEEIKKKHPDKDRLRDEAIQIGAMVIKFVQSLENWPWLGLKMSAAELKCLQCRYAVLSAEELADLGNEDPCETCSSNFNNWKPKRDPEWDRCYDCGRVVRSDCGEDYFVESGTHGIPKGERSKMVCKDCYETKYRENEFLEILAPVADLLKQKNTDYGNSYNESRSEFGSMAFLLRTNDKFARLKNLTNQKAQVNDESVEDTIKDIIGYCTLELRYRQHYKWCRQLGAAGLMTSRRLTEWRLENV